jgi:hypothetical protein
MLVFVHIPKTAGTTLHKVISHQYPGREILIRHDADGRVSEAIPAGQGKPPAVVMGHLSVGLHRYHPGVRYITCLREPVARLVSHYHHGLNDPSHYLHEAIRRDGLDLAAYAASGLSGELSNGMTRMLAGVEDFHGAVVDRTVLELAKRNIDDHFDAVLLSERFDEGLLLLARQMGWKTPWYLRRKVGKYSAAAAMPDAETRRRVEEVNAFDIELHAWVRDRFDRKVKQFPELGAEVQRFRTRNAGIGKIAFLARELRRRCTAR